MTRSDTGRMVRKEASARPPGVPMAIAWPMVPAKLRAPTRCHGDATTSLEGVRERPDALIFGDGTDMTPRGPSVRHATRCCAACLAVAAVSLVACVTTAPPAPVVFDGSSASGRLTLSAATPYALAMQSIAAAMERRLHFPPFQPTLVLCPDRRRLTSALIADGLDPAYARKAALSLDGVSRAGKVFANQESLEKLPWSGRVRFLAHELTHSAQDVLSGGRPTTSDQWLREGLAEWVSWAIVDAEKLGSFERAVQRSRAAVGASIQTGALPGISELVDPRQWVAVKARKHSPPVYALAFVAVDFLIERHGLASVLDYFRLFASSADRLGNFQAAFGESWEVFDVAFANALAASGAAAPRPGEGG